LGREPLLIRSAEKILAADHVILPGVGNFGDAMERLRNYELIGPIKQAVKAGIPFLGICLGEQLLFESSEESPGAEGTFPSEREMSPFRRAGRLQDSSDRLEFPSSSVFRKTFFRHTRTVVCLFRTFLLREGR
jgi:imidazoleglycerol phosphate synthase glutamine amidotransferase subunit HisH